MAYSKTVWNNNTPPDISAENLNKMEQGIYDAQFPDNGSTGQILSKTNDGVGWVDAPTSAEWGDITGQISEQTDLYSELESKITMPSGGTTGQVLTKTATGQAWQDASGGGNVDTVNGISPDANKNVQTAADLTEAAYEALPSTKESDNVDYYLTDADPTVATAEDIPYDNTTSGMTATNVQGAVDELNNGLPKFDSYVDISTVSQSGTFTVPKTGFYMIYANPNTSSGYTQVIIRKGGIPVGGVYTAGGALGTQMTYLEAGEEYTLPTKTNIKNLFLYY